MLHADSCRLAGRTHFIGSGSSLGLGYVWIIVLRLVVQLVSKFPQILHMLFQYLHVGFHVVQVFFFAHMFDTLSYTTHRFGTQVGG